MAMCVCVCNVFGGYNNNNTVEKDWFWQYCTTLAFSLDLGQHGRIASIGDNNLSSLGTYF